MFILYCYLCSSLFDYFFFCVRNRNTELNFSKQSAVPSLFFFQSCSGAISWGRDGGNTHTPSSHVIIIIIIIIIIMTMVIIILIILLTECGHSVWGATRITPVSVSLHILSPTRPFTAGYLFLTSWLSLFNDWIHSHSESPKLTSPSSSNHQKKTTIISSPELSSMSLTKLSSKVSQSSKPFSHI